MKKAVLSIIVAILTIAATTSPLELPTGEITIKAVDEQGKPVAGATVTITFEQAIPKWGGGSHLNVKGKTNPDGEFSASGHSFDTLGGSVQMEGYYTTWPEAAKFNDAVEGKWQPWNPTVEAVLKKIANPIPMYARKLSIQIPVVGQPVGFDLVESDWMPPYGKGKTADFIFQLTKRFASRQDYDASVALSFSNDGDGIQAVKTEGKGISALRLPRSAPEAGYLPQWSESWGFNKSPALDNQSATGGFLFRVRTAKKDNEIKSALYGKIDGEFLFDAINSKTAWVMFTYYLNPAANDENLEFDPTRDLLSDLRDEERVKAP